MKSIFARVFPVILVSAACHTASHQARAPIVQPGAPGEAPREISAQRATDLSQVRFTPADVKFMQGMIGHHAQAIEMTDMIPSHTTNEDIKKLGLRISLSQADEIDMMRAWLRARGQEIPSEHAHHMEAYVPMPGMLSAEEMDRLRAAKGAEFDRLFLQGMIKHHGGALTMVEQLLASPGAAQESEMFAFASDVEADQRMEIDRMGALLTMMQKERPK